MRISIAMATFNGARFLKPQLESFSSQLRLPDELIVCDDCSTDETLQVLETFSRISPFPVKIYRNEKNLGFTRNFERALSLCDGDIVFLSDQDDVWYPNKINVMAELFAQSSSIFLVQADMMIVDENLNSSGITQLENMLGLGFSSANFVHGCCSAVSRELLQFALPLPSDTCGHDSWLTSIAEAFNLRLVYPYALQLYRRHGNNVTSGIGNSGRNLASVGAICRHLFSDPKATWHTEAKNAESLILRIINREKHLEKLGCTSQKNQVVEFLTKRINVINSRIEINKKTRIIRIGLILKLLCNGSYNMFSGWKSALNDLVSSN